LSTSQISGQYVKEARINSPKCSFFRVARWFDFTNFIAEKQSSQQYVELSTEMSCTLVFYILGIYFLERVARNLLQSGIWLKFF